MSDLSLKKKTLIGLMWNAIQRFGAMGIAFLSNLVLVRLLGAEDFAAIGILLVFVTVAKALVGGGFSSALIQRKEVTQTDYSTVFYWNIIIAIVMMAVLCFCAPYIAEYYKTPILCPVLRVQSVILLIGALSDIHTVILSKNISFRILSIRTLIASLISVVVAIIMAYMGYGIWSLVAQEIVMALVSALLLWTMNTWRPSLCFSWNSLQGLFKFGSFILISTICETIVKNIQSLIIGKSFSLYDLGYYTQAKKLENVPVTTATSVLSQVLYPVYSSISDDYARIKSVLRRNISVITYLSFPIMLLLAILAYPIITVLYTDKWIDSVPMFQILCIGGMFHTLNVCNTMLFKALGKSKVFFILQTVKRIINLSIILLSVRYGLYALLWTVAATQIISYALNLIYTHNIFKYTYYEQLSDIIPNLILSLAVAGIVWYIINSIHLESMFLLTILGSLIYVVLYLLLSYLFKYKSLKNLKSLWQ